MSRTLPIRCASSLWWGESPKTSRNNRCDLAGVNYCRSAPYSVERAVPPPSQTNPCFGVSGGIRHPPPPLCRAPRLPWGIPCALHAGLLEILLGISLWVDLPPLLAARRMLEVTPYCPVQGGGAVTSSCRHTHCRCCPRAPWLLCCSSHCPLSPFSALTLRHRGLPPCASRQAISLLPIYVPPSAAPTSIPALNVPFLHLRRLHQCQTLRHSSFRLRWGCPHHSAGLSCHCGVGGGQITTMMPHGV